MLTIKAYLTFNSILPRVKRKLFINKHTGSRKFRKPTTKALAHGRAGGILDEVNTFILGYNRGVKMNVQKKIMHFTIIYPMQTSRMKGLLG